MIIDKIDYADTYRGLSKRLDKALDYLKNTDFSKVEDGKYLLDGEDLRANVKHCQTNTLENCKMEVHHNFLDIQYVLEGEENILYLPEQSLGKSISESPENDNYFFEGKEKAIPMLLKPGYFMIVYPQDGHGPDFMTDKVSTVRKIVVKVRVK